MKVLKSKLSGYYFKGFGVWTTDPLGAFAFTEDHAIEYRVTGFEAAIEHGAAFRRRHRAIATAAEAAKGIVAGHAGRGRGTRAVGTGQAGRARASGAARHSGHPGHPGHPGHSRHAWRAGNIEARQAAKRVP